MATQPMMNDGNVVLEEPSSITMNRTNNDEAQSAVLHRSLHQMPLQVTHAFGDTLFLSSGQRILDATGGAAVACLGHNHPRINAAVAAQMSQFSYCHSLFFSSPVAEEFARVMTESTHGHMTKLFVVSSGSEAMETAVKLARQYHVEIEGIDTKRRNFIARKESYHGTTLGALSMSGHVARRALFEPLLMPNVSHVSACNSYRGMRAGETTEDFVQRLAQELDDEFQRLGPETVCAFVAEPVVGAALGCVPAVPGYFPAMKAVCDRYGALLVLDEIMSGMGRTGTLHAWEQEDVIPDIQTIGKGLGGGYVPVAGVLINKRVVEVLEKGTGAFMHGQTYQGHPVACAVGLEVQQVIKEEKLLDNAKKMGDLLEKSLKKALENHKNVGDIRGKGLFWGIEFVKDKISKEPFDPKAGIAMAVHNKGLEDGWNISLYPGTGTVDGTRGDHILISPAFNCSEETIKSIVDSTAALIREFFSSTSA